MNNYAMAIYGIYLLMPTFSLEQNTWQSIQVAAASPEKCVPFNVSFRQGETPQKFFDRVKKTVSTHKNVVQEDTKLTEAYPVLNYSIEATAFGSRGLYKGTVTVLEQKAEIHLTRIPNLLSLPWDDSDCTRVRKRIRKELR